MKTTNLDKWLYLVRRIEEHREEKAVRELQKLYKSLIKDLRKVMGNTFADYADPETGKLTYADLHRQGLDARLLEEVAAHVSSVSSEEMVSVSRISTLGKRWENWGMIWGKLVFMRSVLAPKRRMPRSCCSMSDRMAFRLASSFNMVLAEERTCSPAGVNARAGLR